MGVIGKMYRVQKGRSLTGKHKVYAAGENVPEEELCGDWPSSLKDGTIKEVPREAPAPVPAQEAADEAGDDDSPQNAFEELMAKTDAELAEIAKEYGVEDAEKLAADKAGLVKAILLKAGYEELVKKIEAVAGNGNGKPKGDGKGRGRGRPPKDGGK